MRATQHTKETGGNPDYYLEYSLTSLYVEKTFGGYLSTINLTNDSSVETVSFSYDGATLAGTVKPGESVTVNVDQRSSIYIKGSVGSDTARIWGWAGVVRAAGPNSSVTTTEDGSKIRLDVTTGLSTMPGFNIPPYTRIDATYPDTVTEAYAYTDGVTLVATITVVYTDTTKQYITSAVKT